MSQTEPEASQRAAAYVRMSRDHQQYSTCNQMDVIHSYARRRNLEVVKEYSDEGKSGLKIQWRAALSQMIGDVVTKKINFSHILVYDVSRWGRFQDPDEAAHYEFICRQAGVAVHYCAEQFENDGGITSTIAKSIKRAMAGEFSRELSAKVIQGVTRMLQLGYAQGGSGIIGLRRMLVDQTGRPKGILNPGEQKFLQTDRVIFVPGPAEEIAVVRWIFQIFVAEGKRATEIACQLNQRGILSFSGRPWTPGKIRDLLHNEKYIGNLVHARRTARLGSKEVTQPPEKWLRVEAAFEGIVSRDLFFKAQELYANNRQLCRFTQVELLENLRGLLKQHGYLSADLIDEAGRPPYANRYFERFGSLREAYQLIGYQPGRNYRHLDIQHRRNQIKHKLIDLIIRRIEGLGATAIWSRSKHTLILNQELRVRVICIRHKVTDLGNSRWRLRRLARIKSDLTMAVRMDCNNEHIQDYYLLPGLEMRGKELSLAAQNGVYLDAYRFQTLDFLVNLAGRAKLSEGKFS